MTTHTPERAAFNENGYVLLPELLNVSEREALFAAIRVPFAQKLTALGINPTDLDWQECITLLFDTDLNQYKQALGAMRRMAPVWQLMTSPKIMAAIKDKLGYKDVAIPTAPVVHLMSDRVRIPGGYYGLEAHQDWPSMQGSLDSAVLWIALTDVRKNTNPVDVVPKSHLGGIYPAEIGQNEAVVAPDIFSESDYISPEVDAGSGLFFSTFTVHRSNHTSDGSLRLAVSIRFENMADKTYAARGFPTAYQSSVHREMFVEGFPSLGQVEDVYK